MTVWGETRLLLDWTSIVVLAVLVGDAGDRIVLATIVVVPALAVDVLLEDEDLFPALARRRSKILENDIALLLLPQSPIVVLVSGDGDELL